MGAWMHAEERRSLPWPYDGLEVCDVAGCVCVIPTPDPASPCGFEREDGSPCGYRQSMGSHWILDGNHPHRPTTCARCGHAIVEAP